MSDESEALEHLIATPGWKLVKEAAIAEWQTRKELGLKAALDDANDGTALAKLRQIQASENAVRWLLDWPANQLLKMKGQVRPASPERRGGL